jgi:hypothetical protein
MNTDPPSPIATEIGAESRRLGAVRLGLERRYGLLLAFIADLGVREGLPRLGESAQRHVAHIRETRERWRAARWR